MSVYKYATNGCDTSYSLKVLDKYICGAYSMFDADTIAEAIKLVLSRATSLHEEEVQVIYKTMQKLKKHSLNHYLELKSCLQELY